MALYLDFDNLPRLLLEKEAYSVGRSQGCDVIIGTGNIAEIHASLVYIAGSWYIVDLTPDQQTFVNGLSISKHKLDPGDIIEFNGTEKARFIEEDSAEPCAWDQTEAKMSLLEDQLKDLAARDNQMAEDIKQGFNSIQGAVKQQARYMRQTSARLARVEKHLPWVVEKLQSRDKDNYKSKVVTLWLLSVMAVTYFGYSVLRQTETRGEFAQSVIETILDTQGATSLIGASGALVIANLLKEESDETNK